MRGGGSTTVTRAALLVAIAAGGIASFGDPLAVSRGSERANVPPAATTQAAAAATQEGHAPSWPAAGGQGPPIAKIAIGDPGDGARPSTGTILIIFARSGQKAFVELAGKGPPASIVLRAFGRAWPGPAAVKAGGPDVAPGRGNRPAAAEIVVPAVRVPVVFSITPPEKPAEVLGELVAYPGGGTEFKSLAAAWDKTITLYSAGGPVWFDQWADAAGLAIKRLSIAELADAKLEPDDEKQKALLILGPSAAGKALADAAKLADDKKVNVLVLDAEWFGQTTRPELGATGGLCATGGLSASAALADKPPVARIIVKPKQMLAGLAELAKQQWPLPPTFSYRRDPWPGIANRWPWIVNEAGMPLVEQLGAWLSREPADHEKIDRFGISRPVVLSYLPWAEQLGRNESADETLLALLAAAAKAPVPRLAGLVISGLTVVGRPKELLQIQNDWPVHLGGQGLPAAGWRPFKVMMDRPVLSAIISTTSMIDRGPENLCIIDLRGRQPVTEEIRQFVDKAPQWPDPPRFLILGDDKSLDDWPWLKLDREKKTINRPGVIWLSDNQLPPSPENQIRLMLKLTELGVPLAPPTKQEDSK